jgi:hypothetical protein
VRIIIDSLSAEAPPETETENDPTPSLMDPYDDNGGIDGGGDESDNLPGGGINNHRSTEQWTNTSARRAEVTSLAPAKPKYIENDVQSEVSKVFTPLEIVLYSNGHDSSQAVRLQSVDDFLNSE